MHMPGWDSIYYGNLSGIACAIDGQEVVIMLAAVKGIIQGNTVIIEDDDIREYDGAEVVVTLLNYPQNKAEKSTVDWDSFAIPSERGRNVDVYMKEMRENDRL